VFNAVPAPTDGEEAGGLVPTEKMPPLPGGYMGRPIIVLPMQSC